MTSGEAPRARLEKKARELVLAGRVRLHGSGGRAMYFSVDGETGEREVSFAPTKGEWSCDCKYSSLKPGHDCSHIIAARLFLSQGAKKADKSSQPRYPE